MGMSINDKARKKDIHVLIIHAFYTDRIHDDFKTYILAEHPVSF